MINIGNKIKTLRKQKDISQETLANYLGVSFQAVSKWETQVAFPDVTLIPAIASFFGISTDELFDFNLYEIEKNVEVIINEKAKYYNIDRRKSEQIIRDGLKKYPGNEVLLNNLIDVLPIPEANSEIIEVCKALTQSAKYDDVKYDAYRIMAEAYASMDEYSLAKEAIENIPEIYFTKLTVAADLLKGEDRYKSASMQQGLSFEQTIDMCEILSSYYIEIGDNKKAIIELTIAKNLILAVENDFDTPFGRSLYTVFKDKINDIEAKIKQLKE